jgi:hypothetical protein
MDVIRHWQGRAGQWIVNSMDDTPKPKQMVFQTEADKTDTCFPILIRDRGEYVLRANALENNVHLYRMVNGQRTEVTGARVRVTSALWHTLRAKAKGNKITCSFGGKQVISTTDNTVIPVL